MNQMLHKTLIIFIGLFLANQAIAQGPEKAPAASAPALITNTMEINENSVTVTKDIDSRFLGLYTQNLKGEQVHYHLAMEDSEGFNWGALVVDNNIVETEVMEYANGSMISYVAYTIYFEDKDSNEKGELMLYELDGKIYLGKAQKVEAVADHR